VGFGIPEEKIRLVQSLNDIVDVVGEYMPLKRQGRDFRALCPFHNEKTPSFYVSPSKQIYKCFGCGAGGDVFSFVMATERVSFPEAIRLLAGRVGVEIEETASTGDGSPSIKERLYKVNSWALSLFRRALNQPEGAAAREWLASRSMDADSIHKFQLGYAPDSWTTLIDKLADDPQRLALLEKAGLAIPREGGPGRYDRFRNRLIFPIFDARGRAIAFGGRSLDGSDPKYLNSPETPVFVKGATLYGLNWAASAARSGGRIAVVEGYTDVIMAHAAGLEWVVATLGTSLTAEHARMLRRYGDEIFLVFDGDAAGMKAADRALPAFIDEDVEVHVALMPDGCDPADIVVQRGAEAFSAELERAQDILDFKMRYVGGVQDMTTTTGRTRAVDEVLGLLRQCTRNTVKQSDYLSRVAQEFGLQEDALRQRLHSFKRAEAHAPFKWSVEGSSPGSKAEQEILEAAVNEPPLRARLAEAGASWFSDAANAAIAQAVVKLDEGADASAVVTELQGQGESEAARRAARMIMEKDKTSEGYEAQFEGAVSFLERERLRRRLDEARSESKRAEEAGDFTRHRELLTVVRDLTGQLQNLKSSG